MGLSLRTVSLMYISRYGVEFENEEDVYKFEDYRNLSNLEAHRNNKSNDELLSLR